MRYGKLFLVVAMLVLVPLATICFFLPQTQAATYTLVKTIDLNPLVGDDGSIEVDVVGDELYVANWAQDKYFRIDPVTGGLLGSFSLSDGILMDNHGSEYNPTTGRLLHASDDDYGSSPLGFDLFFETDTDGVLVNGPYDLFGAGDNSEDPDGLTVDPVTGRIWVSTVFPDGIHEINPSDGTILNHIDVGERAWALGFNPNSGKLFFSNWSGGIGVIKEVAPDGTGLATVFDPGVGQINGMAFTPSGDLALLDFGTTHPPSRLLLYDSSDDDDDVFTTTLVPEDTDGDGVPDDEDQCVNSDLSPTVEIDGCDSGVPNTLLANGCTISDNIAILADFTRAVSHYTNDLKKDGVITGQEKGAIQSCAGQADVP